MSSHSSIVGNITRDPELRFTASGQATCGFGVAVNRRWQVDGEWQEAVSFFNVVAWRDLAENVAESFRKGDRVMVTGRLEQRSWETPEGDKRSIVELVADEVGASVRWATVKVQKTQREKFVGGEPTYSKRPEALDEPF